MAEYCTIHIEKRLQHRSYYEDGKFTIDLPEESSYVVGETIICNLSNLPVNYSFVGAYGYYKVDGVNKDGIVGYNNSDGNSFVFVVPQATEAWIIIVMTATGTSGSESRTLMWGTNFTGTQVNSVYINGELQDDIVITPKSGDLIRIKATIVYSGNIENVGIHMVAPYALWNTSLVSSMDLFDVIDEHTATIDFTWRACVWSTWWCALTDDFDGGRIHMPDNLKWFPNMSNVRTLFAPTASEVGDLGNYLYNGNLINTVKSVTDQIGSVGGSLSDYLIRLIMLPVTIERGDQYYMTVGIYKDAGVPLSVPADNTPKRTVNLGNITFKGLNGNYLDYQGKYQLFLPFYGIVDLSPADVVDKTIGIKYIINIEDGNSLIHITINNTVKYVFSCNVGYNIPIGSSNLSDNLTNAIKDLGMAGIMMGV